MDRAPINLSFVHVCNRLLCSRRRVENDISDSTVRVKNSVHRHVDILDGAVDAKNLGDVRNSNVFRELFNDNLTEKKKRNVSGLYSRMTD